MGKLKLTYSKSWLPFLAIWTHPKHTMRGILEKDPNFGVMLIAIAVGVAAALRTSVLHGLHPMPDLMGIHPVLDDIIRFGIGENAGFLMTASAIFVFGSVMGIGLVALGGLLLKISGSITGGRGIYSHVRSAVAWSFVPYTTMLPAWIVYALVRASYLRATGGVNLPLNLNLMGWDLTVLLVFDAVLRILSLTYLVLALSEIHRVQPVKSVAMVVLVFVPLTFFLIPWQGFVF